MTPIGAAAGAAAVAESRRKTLVRRCRRALAAVESAVPARHDADMRAQTAKVDADNAPTERKDAADRAARQAAQDAAEAGDRLTQLLNPTLPHAAAELADRLEPFAPRPRLRYDWIRQGLTDAAGTRCGERRQIPVTLPRRPAPPPTPARRSTPPRRSLPAPRDALILARSAHYRADGSPTPAADLRMLPLAGRPQHRTPPSGEPAHARGCREHGIVRSQRASQRLALAPDIPGCVRTPARARRSSADIGRGPLDPNFSASRQWGQLRAGGDDQINTSLAAPDPAGFEEDLRLYFAGLDKAQERAQEKPK